MIRHGSDKDHLGRYHVGAPLFQRTHKRKERGRVAQGHVNAFPCNRGLPNGSHWLGPLSSPLSKPSVGFISIHELSTEYSVLRPEIQILYEYFVQILLRIHLAIPRYT